jgi:hypothetical protein
MHFGSPLHLSHISAFLVVGCIVTAPNLQASMHQPQPLHFSSSTIIEPESFNWLRAFLGQTPMQGASVQMRHTIAAFDV